MSVQLAESLKALNFKNYGTFLKYDMFNMIFELSKNYSIIDPIPEGSITIYSRHENLQAAGNAAKDVKLFTELLQCGTKPLDAIAFISVMGDNNGGMMHNCFVHVKADAFEENQFEAISILAATVIVFVSRGAFPSGDGVRGNTPLKSWFSLCSRDLTSLKVRRTYSCTFARLTQNMSALRGSSNQVPLLVGILS